MVQQEGRRLAAGPLRLRLRALVDGKTLLHPIGVKAPRKQQHAQPRESPGFQCRKRRPQIRAFLERAASAVEHQVRIFRKRLRELLKLSQSLFGRTRSVENRSGNVSAFVQGFYPHVNQRRIGIFFLLQFLSEIGRLHGLGGSPWIVKTGARQNGGAQQCQNEQARDNGRLLAHWHLRDFAFLLFRFGALSLQFYGGGAQRFRNVLVHRKLLQIERVQHRKQVQRDVQRSLAVVQEVPHYGVVLAEAAILSDQPQNLVGQVGHGSECFHFLVG